MKMNYSQPATRNEIALPFLPGAVLRLGERVSPRLAADVARSLSKAWAATPPEDRIALGQAWRRFGWGLGRHAPIALLVGAAPMAGAKIYDPCGSLVFSQQRLLSLTSPQLDDEVAQTLARAVLAANAGSIAKAVKRLDRPTTSPRPAVICPGVTDLAQRSRWGLPALPEAPDATVVPGLRDEAIRRRWGLPPLA